MLNDISSPLSLLATRRSGKPRDMVAPGPDAAQLAAMLEIAARVPDHGKIAPWRFVVVGDGQRDALAGTITTAYRAERPGAGRTEIESLEQFSRQAPALVVVLFSPRLQSHIPLWEQELSVGAACMNMLHAATAMGYTGSWLTGWPSFSEAVRDAFGQAHEKIAGFMFFGTPGRALEERPRPDMDSVVSHWRLDGAA